MAPGLKRLLGKLVNAICSFQAQNFKRTAFK